MAHNFLLDSTVQRFVVGEYVDASLPWTFRPATSARTLPMWYVPGHPDNPAFNAWSSSAKLCSDLLNIVEERGRIHDYFYEASLLPPIKEIPMPADAVSEQVCKAAVNTFAPERIYER